MAVSSALITIRQTLAAKKSVFVPAVQSALWALSAKPGPQGPVGEIGPTGPQGPAGGTINFADFYALMPPDNAATVAPGTDVSFPQDGPNSGSDISRTGFFQSCADRYLSCAVPSKCNGGRSIDPDFERRGSGLYRGWPCHRGISNHWHGSRGDYCNQFSFDRSKSCRQCGGAHHHTGCRWSSASLRTSCHCANSVRLPLGQTCRKLFCPQQPITAQGYRSIAYSAVKQVTPKIFIQNMKNT